MTERIIIPTEEVKLKPGAKLPMGYDGTWWRILDVDIDAMTALVIADKGICQKPYNERSKAVTWENCTLRAWLNGEYLQGSFSEVEQNAIVESEISNPDNPCYHTPGGNDTTDRIFLLSLDEVSKYFKSKASRAKGFMWWLRSPGSESSGVVCVAEDGSIYGDSDKNAWPFNRSCRVDLESGCVRPAFKLDLKSELFRSAIIVNGPKTIKLRVPSMCVLNTKLVSTLESADEITVPEGVTELGECCFAGMKRLKSVILPSTLKKVGKKAFAGCKALQTIVVQSNAISWGTDALEGCEKLQYTPEMRMNAAKLCDSFAEHLENVGVQELAYLYMYQRGAVWEKALAEKVTASNASEILSVMAEYMAASKKPVKKPAAAAVRFAEQNALLLTSAMIGRLRDVLNEKDLKELAEELCSDPSVGYALQSSAEMTAASEQKPMRTLSNGVVLYGEIKELFTVDSRLPMGKNGARWRVLDVDAESMTALVIADRIIGEGPYHEGKKDITWEDCTLRAWLNGEYLQQTFSAEEQSAIIVSKISNSGNSQYHILGGNDTEDRMFLLSLDEVQKYFKTDSDRAMDRRWWLRSPGNSGRYAAYVNADGSIQSRGEGAGSGDVCIRPVFKIDLKSEFFRPVISKNAEGETVISNPVLVIRTGSILSANSSASEINLPAFIRKIGAGAFDGCDNLKTITWEKQPQTIEEKAFDGCPQLKLPAQFYLGNHVLFSRFAKYMPADPAVIANILLLDVCRQRAIELLSVENAADVVDEVLRMAADIKMVKEPQTILRFALSVTHCVDAERMNRLADFLDELKIDGAYLVRKEIGSNDMETGIVRSLFWVDEKILHTPPEKFTGLPGLAAVLAAAQPYADVYWKGRFRFYDHDISRYYFTHDASDEYEKNAHAEEVAAALDHTSLMTLLEFWIKQDPCWFAPYAAFADESELAGLLKEMRALEKDKGLSEGIIRVRGAVLLNDTNDAMRYADSRGLLGRYAELRGMDEDTLRDTIMDDLGLDEKGRVSYVLAGKTYTALLNKDLTLTLQDETGKIIKSLPKRGADPEEYAAADKAFKELKKDIKPTAKRRNAKIFAEFLSGMSRKSADWKQLYLKNPLLRLLAQLIVWDQGGYTFVLKDDGKAYDANGSEYKIGNRVIKVAHPMEMSKSDLTAWQTYFTDNALAQPFAQVWEPVVDASIVKPGRYDDCTIELYHLMNKEKHGIILGERDYLALKDCSAELVFKKRCKEWVHNLFEVKNFRFEHYTRQVNHIVVILDKSTVASRIVQDDITVERWLGEFTLPQILEFIDLAAKNNCFNVGAMLQEYKQEHFENADSMDMFTLDLL